MDSAPFFLNEKAGYEYKEPEKFLYVSHTTNSSRNAKVLLPKNYDPNKKYPLLVLLHGYLGNENSWIDKRAHIMIQNMQFFQGLEDMIVVFADSNLNEDNRVSNLPYDEAVSFYDKSKEDVLYSLVPAIESSYSVDDNSYKRYIGGLSLGGRNALAIGNESNMFHRIGAFSPEEVNADGGKNLPQVVGSFLDGVIYDKYIEISTGSEDKDTLKGTESILENLKESQIEFNYYELPGGHEAKVWKNSLYNFLNSINLDR